MSKVFLAGPISQHDEELVTYRFAAAKQRLLELRPSDRVFNSAEDLDVSPLREFALACNLNPDDPIDRLKLLVTELLDSSAAYFMEGLEQDKLCQRLHSTATELSIEVHEL